MTHIHQHTPHPCQPMLQNGRRRLRALLLIPLAGIALTLASCSGGGLSSEASFVTDTQPVGDGLKVIGYALLGAAVVVVLGKMTR